MERYEALMTMEDTLAYSLIDSKGAEMWDTIETLKSMMNDAEADEDWKKYSALEVAINLMYRKYETTAKAYCTEVRNSEGFREYAEAHKNLWMD